MLSPFPYCLLLPDIAFPSSRLFLSRPSPITVLFSYFKTLHPPLLSSVLQFRPPLLTSLSPVSRHPKPFLPSCPSFTVLRSSAASRYLLSFFLQFLPSPVSFLPCFWFVKTTAHPDTALPSFLSFPYPLLLSFSILSLPCFVSHSPPFPLNFFPRSLFILQLHHRPPFLSLFFLNPPSILLLRLTHPSFPSPLLFFSSPFLPWLSFHPVTASRLP